MAEPFHDHFSGIASAYAAFRPRYPQLLFERVAALAPRHEAAWDCGTGSGQAAVGLAPYFEHVWATDASAEQLAAAESHPRVHYRVARAEESGLAPASVDLVTAAQALHWFDRSRFYDEVRRVLRPGGVLAAWCYDLMDIEPAIDAHIHEFYERTVGPYWPPERSLVEARYATLEFPFEEIELHPCLMEAQLNLDELTGYMRTWSAVIRYRDAEGHDPVTSLLVDLAPRWGDPQTRRSVRWSLAVRAGRV